MKESLPNGKERINSRSIHVSSLSRFPDTHILNIPRLNEKFSILYGHLYLDLVICNKIPRSEGIQCGLTPCLQRLQDSSHQSTSRRTNTTLGFAVIGGILPALTCAVAQDDDDHDEEPDAVDADVVFAAVESSVATA